MIKSELKRKIKVLAFIWSMGNGGAQQVLINNLRFFQNDPDVDFKLICFNGPSTNSKYDEIIRKENLKVRYLNYPRSIIRIPVIRYPFNKLVEFRTWIKVIKEEKPDIVHVHISQLLTTTALPMQICKVPIRLDTLHSNPYRYTGTELKLIKHAFQKQGVIPICLNQKQAADACDHYKIDKYEILHNGFDFRKIREGIVSKSEARKRLKLNADDLVLAGVGRLDPVKNYELMIDVFAEVCKKRKDSKLIIAGAGDQEIYKRRAVQYGIGDKVLFVGQISNVCDVYCAADALLMTSHSEASPLTLVEAQICGTDCIISSGVPDESVITDKVVKMQKGATPTEWADALLNGHDKVKPLLTESDYDLENTNKQLKDLYLKYWKNYER